MVMADDAACRALVRWGLSCPKATEQLPPDQAVFVPHEVFSSVLPDAASTSLGHPFWSPLTCCILFLCATAADRSHPVAPGLPRSVQSAITPELMERLMRVGIEHPCGRAPVCMQV
jgi:hypothetical protein